MPRSPGRASRRAARRGGDRHEAGPVIPPPHCSGQPSPALRVRCGHEPRTARRAPAPRCSGSGVFSRRGAPPSPGPCRRTGRDGALAALVLNLGVGGLGLLTRAAIEAPPVGVRRSLSGMTWRAFVSAPVGRGLSRRAHHNSRTRTSAGLQVDEARSSAHASRQPLRPRGPRSDGARGVRRPGTRRPYTGPGKDDGAPRDHHATTGSPRVGAGGPRPVRSGHRPSRVRASANEPRALKPARRNGGGPTPP